MSTTLDSLIGSEFEVTLDGQKIEGLFRLVNWVTFAVNDSGQRLMPPFGISKMVQRNPNLPLNVWIRETTAARHGSTYPKRNLVVSAVDDGVVTRRWTVVNATIQSVRYNEFNTSSFQMVEEVLTIAYEDIEEEFTTN